MVLYVHCLAQGRYSKPVFLMNVGVPGQHGRSILAEWHLTVDSFPWHKVS